MIPSMLAKDFEALPGSRDLPRTHQRPGRPLAAKPRDLGEPRRPTRGRSGTQGIVQPAGRPDTAGLPAPAARPPAAVGTGPLRPTAKSARFRERILGQTAVDTVAAAPYSRSACTEGIRVFSSLS